ncbi:MAG: nicotinate (nicotinamide) nucleotide adenylyltransferase [Endomicrobia bacterium]|nr:nicotinate (nicotinamide) nucleotide adenylyltransferase [Endomicrobiia bacterium]MCX7941223.1 nicotinate (nicotinamide) nucleotide adenylyltransferase [Endomicrobiia bacterium]MDW8056083.1 nicotinate (nicotinamide) nucleotide adenylyltransferase [Elusimicrobiota bacterium]
MSSIILFGGTFDPIHMGHLILAEYAAEFVKAKKVLFIPCYKPPHKLKYEPVHWKHRLNMVKLAVNGISKFEVSDFEIKRKEISYTYVTVDWFSKVYKADDLYFLIGFDSLLSLHTWQNWEKIIQKVKFLVGERMVDKSKMGLLPSKIYNKVIFFDSPIIEISSTEIRERLKKSLSIKYLVPEEVEKYILRHGLYKK